MYISIKKDSTTHNVLAPFLSMNLLWDGAWLAGGAVRDAISDNPNIADYDMFFASEYHAKCAELILENQLGFECVFRCPLGELATYKKDGMKIQLITKFFYDSMESVIDRFDITACRYVTDGTVIYTKYSSIRDTKKKQINFHCIDFPNATLKRVQKYILKDYRLTNKAVTSFVDRIYAAGALNERMDLRFYVD